ncbi:hypothetical protein, partial [Nocardioides malaquae]|uniref:hypothetical protein n=1 Tax=Nocardioides malaquae TaxID=2773426 RepID=UPI001D0CEED1
YVQELQTALPIAHEVKLMQEIQLLCVIEVTFTYPVVGLCATKNIGSAADEGRKDSLDCWCGNMKTMARIVEHEILT